MLRPDPLEYPFVMLKRTITLYREAYAGLPGGAWLLAAAEFINRCGFMVLVFLNIYLTKHLHYSLPQAGVVLAAFGLGSIGGGYLGGALVDKLGIRPIMLASLFLSAVTLVLAGYVTAYAPLTALVFLYGLVSAALFPANDTAMSRFCFGEMRAKGFALRRLSANLGITFGPVIGGFLITVDYRLLFWVDGLTTLASAIVVALFIKHLPAAAGPVPGQTPPAARSPWRDGPFLAFMGLMLVMVVVFSQLFSTFNLYLNTVYGLPEKLIGPLWAVNTIMIVTIEMVLIHALRRRSEMKIVALGTVFIALGFGLLPFGRGFLYAAATVAVWTMGEILTMPLSATVVAHRAGLSTGRYMGVLSLIYSMGNFLAPLLGNWLYDKIGGDALWPVMGGAALLVAWGIWSMRGVLAVPKPADPSS